jgi:death on curing protein
VRVRYLDLDDYLSIAVEVTGQPIETVVHTANIDLADSALHAPGASFSGQEFYPDFVDKAAVLIVRLAKNHPLPDGNKRAAWVYYGSSWRSTVAPSIRTRRQTKQKLQCWP